MLGPIGSVLSAIEPILAIAKTLLEIAKVFIEGVEDPFGGLLDAIIEELETLINDLFATGFYIVTVNPFKLEGIRRFDDFGTPLLTPGDIIDEMVESFDDQGDEARPQFTDAEMTAIGIIATAPDLAGLLGLIQELIAIFKIPEWELVLEWHQEKADDTQVKSEVPDWESLRLNSFEPFGTLQKDLIALLEAAKGTRIVPDNNIADLIDMLIKKIERLQDILDRIQEILDNAAGAASGLWVFDYPPTAGGNEAIKAALRDPYLEQCVPNGYSIGTLIVGGGPSLEPVNALRQLLL